MPQYTPFASSIQDYNNDDKHPIQGLLTTIGGIGLAALGAKKYFGGIKSISNYTKRNKEFNSLWKDYKEYKNNNTMSDNLKTYINKHNIKPEEIKTHLKENYKDIRALKKWKYLGGAGALTSLYGAYQFASGINPHPVLNPTSGVIQ